MSDSISLITLTCARFANCFIVSAFVPGKISAKRVLKRAKGYILPLPIGKNKRRRQILKIKYGHYFLLDQKLKITHLLSL